MIINFKIFEAINKGKPEVGDWVICHNRGRSTNLEFSSENYIGKIIELKNKHFEEDMFLIKYENEDLPETLKKVPIYYSEKYIKYWSKNKEDLETILAANKYNL